MTETPKTLNEAVDLLIADLTTEEVEAIKLDKITMVSLHHGMGTCIRNDWGLWQNSELRTHFLNMGLWHADDMSNIILQSFIYKVKNKPFDVNKQIKRYRTFWSDQNVNNDEQIQILKNQSV